MRLYSALPRDYGRGVLIRVLGSAAGGGFPQWNCGCRNCVGVRTGALRAQPRTQESVAVSVDGQSWFVVNASPEIRHHVESFPALHPRALRHSPMAGLLLTNGDLDHCLGLLSLRESYPLQVYASESVRQGFVTNNVFYRTLERFDGQITWHRLAQGVPVPLAPAEGPAQLVVTAIAIKGKPPLHLEGVQAPHLEDNLALRIQEPKTGRTLAYVSGCGGPSAALDQVLEGADCVFFDGTFWSSDELIRMGIGERRAEDMAHWPVGGTDGSLRMLAALPARRRILIHLNNTNPILIDDSQERAAVHAAGVEVAHDGLEIEL
jgi:pyrroloquinoline quinone biosynthesis protein B